MTFRNDLSVESVSDVLKDRRIALCVTGSIAAVETVKLVRELRRHGAEVRAFLTPAAEQFITPLSLHWGTTHPVVTSLSGGAEHIVETDLVLVAPASFDTVNKSALGLADNVVTTLIASAWGRKLPIVFVPAMHESLCENPVFQRNCDFLKKWGHIYFLGSKWEEGKIKLLDVETIVAWTSHILNQKYYPNKLSQKKILLTAGPTEGPIDPVRFMSNTSSGALGVKLAYELFLRGAIPTLVYGPGKTQPHSFYQVIGARTPAQMLEAVLSQLREISYDAAIFSAAVLDHVPRERFDQKLSSQEPLCVDFVQTPKIIREVDAVCSLYKIGFKLEWKKSEEELLKIGIQALEMMKAQVIVVNDLFQISGDQHPALIMDRKNKVEKVYTKNEIVKTLINILKNDL